MPLLLKLCFEIISRKFFGQIFGAIWYLLSIERQDACWKENCNKPGGNCNRSYFCGGTPSQNTVAFLNSSCPINPPDPSVFDFGIYLPALQNVAQSQNFAEKLLFCLWWGLRNLRQAQFLQNAFSFTNILTNVI